ncbi:hypothetical protein [Actinoalloteichus spitiensis]|uniref:hypothetical protein n=1 Tax=Actinoalloteichus spitiensis TaxID=252394 RepID=UPI001B7FA31D|nr:hypothetical protein [Actinoalloteichus spitiensis]
MVGSVDTTRTLDLALRKGGAVWVAPANRPARLVWTVWRAGALWVAVGPGEQQVPGLTDDGVCQVTVRSPSTRSHLLELRARARLVTPDEDALAALTAARRNRQPAWSEVYRLVPEPGGTGGAEEALGVRATPALDGQVHPRQA